MKAMAPGTPLDGKVSLLFGVHAHQPNGNFPFVMDAAHELCYGPFLRTLYRYPDFRFAIHFSGPLLDYLTERYPADVDLLAEMAARGQAELFGAGDTEPVLAVIPNRDRLGQIERLSGKLERRFGQRPQGAWLTERVWESTVVPALADCGIQYVTVDDYHFLCTGRRQDELHGYFSTEEDGRRIDLFPISEALRYRFPFAPAHEAVAYLEGLEVPPRGGAAVYFDDIEKFGVWPETYAWVYEKRWLELFIEGVLASPRVVPCSYREFHASQRTRGPIYIPTVSYVEMNQWTLPPAAAATYAGMMTAARAAGRYEVEKPFVRGGIWKNFLSRYPESNWMHKRMLSLSARVGALGPGAVTAEQGTGLRDLLYKAQANDAYWHGLFGGLYLPHLRRANFRNLVALEAALDQLEARPGAVRVDVDLDGIDEIFLHNSDIQAVVTLDGSAAVVEFDDYRLLQNFGDTLRRHLEHYHALLGTTASAVDAGDGLVNPHERVSFKEPISPADAAPDDQAQSMLRDAWQPSGGEWVRLQRYAALGTEEMSVGFEGAAGGGRVRKRIAITGDVMTASWQLSGVAPGAFRTVLALAMPSCDGVAGRYVVNGEIPGGFGQSFEWTSMSALSLEDLFMGGAVALTCSPPARVLAAPYRTVSQSEDGFERIMQAVNLEVSWAVASGDEVLTLSLGTRVL